MVDWKKISLEELAAYLSQGLRERGIDTVLVGGACVTIYSGNRYQSYDLDFVTYDDSKEVKRAMGELGFHPKGKYFVQDECPWMVEFVAPPVAVGDQPIHQFEQRASSLGTIQMLRCEDSVKDRLASYFHWNDRQGLEQALDICLICRVDLKEIRLWAVREGEEEKYKEFLSRLKKINKSKT